MKNKKALALIVSLALIVGVVLPGTLALSTGQDSAGGEFTVQEAPQPETPAPETPAAPEAPVTPKTPAVPETPASENPVFGNPVPETPVPETPAAPPAQADQQPAPEPPAQEPEQKECTCGAAEGQPHAEGCPLYTAPVTDPSAEPETPAPENPACTCGAAEGQAHAEGCPLYTAPVTDPSAEPEAPTTEDPACTCDPQPAEGEPHQEGCPLYIAPEPQPECTCGVPEGDPHKNTCPLFAHLDTCPGKDECEDETCLCPCHLFERIMNCQTLDEIWILLEETTDEALATLTDEQNAQINAWIEALEPAPLPAIVIEESDPPVASEIARPTVNYTYVAPFGAPVTGGNY